MERYCAEIDKKLMMWAVLDTTRGVFVRHFVSKTEAEEFAYRLNEHERRMREAAEHRDEMLQEARAKYADELNRMEKEYGAMLQRLNEAYQEDIRLMEGWCDAELRRIEDLPQQDSDASQALGM